MIEQYDRNDVRMKDCLMCASFGSRVVRVYSSSCSVVPVLSLAEDMSRAVINFQKIFILLYCLVCGR